MDGTSAVMDALRSLHHLDKDITLAINSWNSPATDVMWQVFSDNKIWIVLYLAIAALIIVRLGWKRGLILIACCAVCVASIDQFANLIKMSVQRLRPVHDAEMISRGLHVLEVPGKLYGFFSAHAANATSFVACTMVGINMDKKHNYTILCILLSIWAALVSISRVFVGKHFFGDVCTGILVGVIIGVLFGLLARLICSKIKAK